MASEHFMSEGLVDFQRKMEAEILKIKLVMIGQCPNCHKEITRRFPIDITLCKCGNPDFVEVELSPALMLPKRVFARFEKLSSLSGVPLDKLVNKLLLEAARVKLADCKPLPQIAVTTKERF
jgi:ribosomal protein L37AE/L43A